MTILEITSILEEVVPLDHAEDFDNVGLLVGHPQQEVNGILVTLDTLEVVIDEAIAKNCNLIISFHPIIFNGLKKITGSNYVERTVLKAIQNNIAIYSIHTALDNSPIGVNAKICEVLEVRNPEILIPKKGTIKKLTTYIPVAQSDTLRSHLFQAGGGAIGNYSECSFGIEGTGTFTAGENANPTLGKIGSMHREKEVKLTMTFPAHLESRILEKLFKEHPYEEVAYEVVTLDNTNQHLGMGMIGTLKNPISEFDFLNRLKKVMHAKGIRHSKLLGKPVQKVAVLGGSGAFAIKNAIKAKADIFVTADVKYHQFYEAEDKMIIADIGHFETEQFTKNLLVALLTKKIPNFAVTLSESITNPIKYF